jgi:hypothetical protein
MPAAWPCMIASMCVTFYKPVKMLCSTKVFNWQWNMIQVMAPSNSAALPYLQQLLHSCHLHAPLGIRLLPVVLWIPALWHEPASLLLLCLSYVPCLTVKFLIKVFHHLLNSIMSLVSCHRVPHGQPGSGQTKLHFLHFKSFLRWHLLQPFFLVGTYHGPILFSTGTVCL